MEQVICVKKLIDKIIYNENLYPGDKISYDRLVEISKKYNITPYTLAVCIFGITQSQYQAIHSKASNANNCIILKHLIPEMKENAIGFRNVIKENENLTEGSLINYEQLQCISNKYNIPEKMLAVDVLQISEYSYRKIKNNPSANTAVFYQNKLINSQTAQKNEEINSLRWEILRNENLKMGDKINYEQLVQLSKKYNIEEKELALSIFGITLSSFYHIKSERKKNAIILNGFLNDEELKKILIQILDLEDIQPHTKINYKILQELSEKYFIHERILALYVLGITENQYYNMKYNPEYILKNGKQRPSLEELQKLKGKIFEQEKLSVGERISYSEIKNIQEKYGLIIDDLLYILGITKYAYYFIKSKKNYSSIVKDMDTYFITQILSETMPKERFYTKMEIEQICKANNISLQDFFDYILGKAVYFGYDTYEKLLNSKGKIWMGDKCKLSNDFINKNLNLIRKIARKVSHYIYYKYKSEKRNLEKEDLEQETYIVILETCGDLEKNFDNDELSRMIYLRARATILKFIDVESKDVSIFGYYNNSQNRSIKGNGKNTDLILKDEHANTEMEALYNYENEFEKTSMMRYLSKLLEEGYDQNIALEKTASVFDIDQSVMLDLLKKELLEKENIKITNSGQYVLTLTK